MEGPGTKLVDNETFSSTSRTTKAGRKFTYKINVLQQPIRARACGSGAKSSADRRPVDPPPIVELKVYEHFDGAEDRDVTFAMSANYFLFATLEQARHQAQGRVQQDHSRLTVLTGTPVAGMVYLDRPSPAGYFIFPDLSVRHEGRYRLSFSLYEELKELGDEDQDDDVADSEASFRAHVTHRLEVKSIPFTVFSAKKFPGLTESTALSRMVAEQGCRVRIRRDVRMRRRDAKSEWDIFDPETAEARARISATPEATSYSGMPTPHPYMDPVARPRSGSNASHHSLAPSLPLSRRPSLQELNQGYHAQSYGAAPHTPQATYPQSSPYGPSPSQPYGQPSYVQQQSMHPPPPQYPQQTYQAPPPAPSAPSSQNYYGYASAAAPPPPMQQPAHGAPSGPSPAYEPQEHHHHRPSVDHSAPSSADHRRSSTQYPYQQPQPSYPARQPQESYPSSQSNYPPGPPPFHPTHAGHQSTPSYGHLEGFSSRPAPIQPPTRTTGASTPLSGRPSFPDTKLPPINTTLSMMGNKYIEPASPASAAPSSSHHGKSAQGSSMDSHKRGYGQVFNDRHLSQPLRYGERPSTPGHPYYPSHAEVDDSEDRDLPLVEGERLLSMLYRRADGRHCERQVPPGEA